MKPEFQAMLLGRSSKLKEIKEIEHRLLEQGKDLVGIDKEKFQTDVIQQIAYLKKKEKIILNHIIKRKPMRKININIDGEWITTFVPSYAKSIQVQTKNGLVSVRLRK
jgi:hypothetical protein